MTDFNNDDIEPEGDYDNGDIEPDLFQEACWLVISAYFNEKGLVRQQLDSFDEFIQSALQRIIDDTPEIELQAQKHHLHVALFDKKIEAYIDAYIEELIEAYIKVYFRMLTEAYIKGHGVTSIDLNNNEIPVSISEWDIIEIPVSSSEKFFIFDFINQIFSIKKKKNQYYVKFGQIYLSRLMHWEQDGTSLYLYPNEAR